MRVFFLMTFVIIIKMNSYAQQLSSTDSTIINNIVNKIDSGSYEVSTKVSMIPKFIIAAIENKSKSRFRITDKKRLYANTDALDRKKYNRFLHYVANTSEYYVIAYEFGGFVTNTHVIIINYEGKRVLSLFNFIVSPHIQVKMLPSLFRAPNFNWKNSEIF